MLNAHFSLVMHLIFTANANSVVFSILFILKKNKKERLVINYKLLNTKIIKDRTLLLLIIEL